MKVVAYFKLKEVRWVLADSDVAELQRRCPNVRVVSLEDETGLAAELADADAFVGWHFPRELFPVARRLRWVHSASAGIEANLFPELVASAVILTNSAGLHSVSIPEHVFALMLALARNLPAAWRQQQERRWDRFGIIAGSGGIRAVAGSNLAILGAGAIGRALVRKAAALDMRVRVMRNRPDRAVAGAEAVVGPSALHELLGWAHFVVLAVPLTAQTRQLIGSRELQAMRSDAYLVNIARGEVVDEAALADALHRGAIAGAGLDVFAAEPLPEDSPLWGVPNLIITPHVSGYAADYFAKVLALFGDNLERFAAGKPLRNVVDKQLGYADAED
ncbi:MAG TPA: D-2-hydroxyacid dehydrogenase [Candidatus Kryptonia bacterium]|nr:D-2-hydroxyacid dehydrogenase [Candidatus Kryptonia bacterium]